MNLLEFLMNIPVQYLSSMHAQNYNYFSSIAKGKSCLAVRLFSSFQRKWEQKFPSLACHDISWPFGVVCVICGTGYHWLTLRSESNIFHNKGIEGFPQSRKSIWLVLIYTLLQFVWKVIYQRSFAEILDHASLNFEYFIFQSIQSSLFPNCDIFGRSFLWHFLCHGFCEWSNQTLLLSQSPPKIDCSPWLCREAQGKHH